MKDLYRYPLLLIFSFLEFTVFSFFYVIRKTIPFFIVFLLVSCSGDKNNKNPAETDLVEDETVTENFNEALGDMLEEISDAVDVKIDPDDFDYDKASISLSLTSENSYFDRFQVGIKFIQLIDMDGFVFTLYDYNFTQTRLSVDFSRLVDVGQLLLHQPNVPVGAYKSLLIEFDFTDIDIRAWSEKELKKIYLISDDARTFSFDQETYRMSVDLSTEPLILVKGGYQHINAHLNLDESILKREALKNSLPPGAPSGLMVFHPSLDIQLSDDNLDLFMVGKYESINDTRIRFLPIDFVGQKRYLNYFKDLEFSVTDSTRFSINNKSENITEANILLAPQVNGYVRVQGKLVDDEILGFSISTLEYADNGEFDKHRFGQIHTSSGSDIRLSSKAVELKTFTDSASVESITKPRDLRVDAFDELELLNTPDSFIVPLQQVSVLSSGDSIAPYIHLHPSQISGRVNGINGSTISIDVTSFNHFSKADYDHPSEMDVTLGDVGSLIVGSYAIFYGYFYSNDFMAVHFKPYDNDNVTMMVWLDEMPPNEALTDAFTKKSSVVSLTIDSSITDKSSLVYKRNKMVLAPDDGIDIEKIVFTDTQDFYIESYTTLNPHVSKYSSLQDLLAALASLIEDGAKVYSLVYRGTLSADELVSDSGNANYLKVRIRGRWIDSALAYSIFDDDIHGERRLGGLTLGQLGAIIGTVAGLLILEFILEKKKLGPLSQAKAPNFCKPNKKSSTGGKAPKGAGANAASKLKSGASSIGSIGGIAECLKKLATFAESEQDLYKLRKQINPDALYIDGEDGKYSSLAVLNKKYLNAKGIEEFSTPEGKIRLEKILNTSKRLKQVFSKRFGALGALNRTSFEAAFRIRVDLAPKSRADNDLFIKLSELDTRVQEKILAKIEAENLDAEGQDKIKKAIVAAANKQNDGATIQDVVKAFNDTSGLSGDDALTVDDSVKDKNNAVTPDAALNNSITSLRDIENAYAKYQVETKEAAKTKAKQTLALALGLDKNALGGVGDIDEKVRASINDFREDVDKKNTGLLADKAKVLRQLQDNSFFHSDKFFQAQAEMLIHEKLGEDVKRTVIDVETSKDYKVDVKKLAKEFKKVSRQRLSVSSAEGGVDRKQLLTQSLDEIIKAKGSSLNSENVQKLRRK